MTVTLDQAKAELNITWANDDAELQLYVDAANTWVAAKVDNTDIAPVELATLFLVDHLWQSQRGPANIPVAGDEMVSVASRSYAIPNRVKELLEPYVGSTVGVPLAAFPDADCYWPDRALPIAPTVFYG